MKIWFIQIKECSSIYSSLRSKKEEEENVSEWEVESAQNKRNIQHIIKNKNLYLATGFNLITPINFALLSIRYKYGWNKSFKATTRNSFVLYFLHKTWCNFKKPETMKKLQKHKNFSFCYLYTMVKWEFHNGEFL